MQHASSDIITPTDSMLMSFAPTANTYVNSIQGDRQMCGGAYVGEEIAFSRTLEPAERKYLEDLMLWKWKAVGEEPVWTNAYFAAVAVTNRATLSFTCAANPIVNALEGAGAINAIRLQDVTSVSAIGAELAAGDHLTVDGKVTFGDAVTVTISGSGLVFATPGDYTIIEATGGLENVDLTSWTCDTSAFSSRRTYSLRQVGDTKVVLHVERKGAMIIVR